MRSASRPRDRRIGLAGELRVVGLDVLMAVPTPFVLHAAGINLHEADAALDQPAGHEALPGEVVAPLLADAVQLVDVLRLLVDVDRLGRGHLHAIGQLKALDAGGQLQLLRRLRQAVLVELRQQIERRPLLRFALVLRADTDCRSGRLAA